MAKATLSDMKTGKTVEYDDKDPADKKRAWMSFWDLAEEEYDRREAESKKWTEDFNKKYPALKNLVWANDEMYYTDDEGNRLDEVDTKAHMDKIQEQIRDSFKEMAPQAPLIVNGEEKDRFDMLDKELDKTKFERNNARAFIMGILDEEEK